MRKGVKVLATQLGIALSGQELMRREQRVADRLQRALLPETLPVVDRTEFHAAYLPASDEAEIGGDWFDAFTLPNGRVAISVGDVAGHGLKAAVIMGEVRQAIRTVAVAGSDAAAVLDYVNRIIMLRQSLGMVTAVFGTYDPVTSTLAYASAGHPTPILAFRNGLVRMLPAGSLPLGCADSLDTREWTFTVPEGGRVVFYTDGLIENTRDVIAGERQLREAIRDLLRDETIDGAGTHDPALALQQRIFGGVANRDDAAILTLSRRSPVKSYVFSAVPMAPALARGIAAEKLDELGVTGETRFGVLVALGEAVANAVEHAYRGGEPGLIRLELAQEETCFVLGVQDFGRWRPFVHREEPRPRPRNNARAGGRRANPLHARFDPNRS